MNWLNATWTVRVASRPINVGHRNAFHDPIRMIVLTAAMMPVEFGATIRQNAVHGLHPSTSAASSSSTGKSRKNCRNR